MVSRREATLQPAALLEPLHHSTADLAPGASTTAADLQTVRRLIAQALASGQADPVRISGARPDLSDRPSAEATSALLPVVESAIADLEAADAGSLRVFRRERALRTTQDAFATPLWAAGQVVERTIGPFATPWGQEVWFDFIRVVRRVLVRRGAGGQAILAVPLRVSLLSPGNQPSGSQQQFVLAPGSVWFSAPLAAPGATPGSYAGLRIAGGTLDVSSPATLVGWELIVPAGAVCTLTLTLDPQSPPAPAARVAEDARAAVTATPATVTLRFEPTSATLIAADRARLQAYDQQVDLSFQPGPATFEVDLNRLMFPFEPQPRRFVVGVPRSKTFVPEGRARIEGGGWALPVATGDPGSLGAAAGVGGLAVRLGPGLSAAWTTLEGGPARLGPALVMTEPGRLVVVAPQARLANGCQRLRLGTVGRLDLTYGAPAPVRYFAEAGVSEAVLTVCDVSATLDRPLTVDGARVALRGSGYLSWIERRETQLLYRGLGFLAPQPGRRLGFGLSNAVLFSGAPALLGIAGEIEGQAVITGKASILSGFYQLLPILPDPYATSAPGFGVRRSDAPIGVLGILVDWAADRPPRLDFTLPSTAWLGLVGDPRQPPQSVPAASYVELPHGVARPLTPDPTRTAGEDAEGLLALGQLMNRWTGPVGDLTLLDVSTNADLFGVRYGFFGGRRTALASVPAVAAPVVEAMHLQVPARTLRVITAPAVSWEAVVTRELVQSASGPVYFPSPLTFPDSGGPTSVGVETVALVRAAPNPAIDSFMETLGPRKERGGISFTLPYGIVAVATVPDATQADRPDVSLLRPAFPGSARGARQISVRARGTPPNPDGSPSLPGAAIILRNARGPFAPVGGMSVLSDVVTPVAGPDVTFNDNFAPGPSPTKVPVVRVDFTGYGESLFSDWRNPEDAAAVVSQARFDVIVGRTVHEVIQIRSILYPCAARLVRTITLQRENRGTTVRHDSGWKHVAGGYFDFPTTTVVPPPVTHPGVVRGFTRIVNIRQMTDAATLSDGTLLAAVMFDCHVDIEGVVAGGTPDGVISRGQVGYVQMTDPGKHGQLSAALFAELLQQKGALGGPVDCEVEVGRIGGVAGSGLNMRVTRVSVDRTIGGSPQEFAASAQGSPALPAGGSWSVVRQGATDENPVAVPRDNGTPLVRRGPASVPSTVNPEPYRFADPADVLNAAAPLAEYGILFSTPAHRILFRRPKVERGDHAVTSAVPAVLADNYARAASPGGLFPAAAQWTLLLAPAWKLSVLAGGHLRLDLPPGPPVTVTNPVRALSNSPTLRTRIEYRHGAGTPSAFALAVDSSQPVRWSYGVDRLSHINEAGSLGDVLTLESGIDAADAAPFRMPDPDFLLGPCFAAVQSALDLLAMLGLPKPLDVSVTNSKIELEAKLSIPLGPPPEYEIDLVVMKIKEAAVAVGFGFEWDVCAGGGPKVKAVFEAGAMAIIRTPYTPLVAIGLVKMKIAMASDNPAVVTFRVGAGVGVDLKVAGFGVTAYYASFIEVIAGDTVFGIMFGILFKGSMDLVVIEAALTFEARMGLIRRECPPVVSVWGLLQASVAVEVSIFFVIDISFTWEVESTVLFSGESSCAIPEAV